MLKSSCLGTENYLHFEERTAIEDNIRTIIGCHKKLRKLFYGTENIPILKGMDYEPLTGDNQAVVLGGRKIWCGVYGGKHPF